MTARGFMLVGEAPNAATVGRPALWLRPDASGIPHAANRLLEYSGLELRPYLRTFPHRTDVWPDLRPKRIAEGRKYARFILEHAAELGPDCLGVIALGSWAARAFAVLYVEPFEWGRPGTWGAARVRMARLPHPCERSGWWRDTLNAVRARAWFRDLSLEVADAQAPPLESLPDLRAMRAGMAAAGVGLHEGALVALCTRCGLPRDVHGHGETGRADSHPFE